jgi:DNA-binding XRE family transcriptional regulator
MPATRPIDELRRQAAALILSRLEKTSVMEAAAELNVSRQALYDIKKKKYCPSLALIERACEAWGLEFTFRGLRVGKKTLRSGKMPLRGQAKTQLSFEALQFLGKEQLEAIKTKKIGGTIEISLRFRLGA